MISSEVEFSIDKKLLKLKIVFQLLSVLFVLFFSGLCLAQQNKSQTNQLAVSQGISSPTTTHLNLFSNGFTYDNPVAASYQQGYHVTGSLDGADSTSFGLDMGIGDGQYGFAAGVYSNGCEGCESFVRGTLGAIWGGFGIGFGVQDGYYSMGMLFNPHGLHRVGFIGEFEDPDGLNNNRSSFGLGYSYILPQFTFSMDLSKQVLENDLIEDSALLWTPGIAVRVDIFSVSLSYDVFLNDIGNRFSDQVWFGIGVKPFSNFEFKFYGEYIDRWNIQATWFF